MSMRKKLSGSLDDMIQAHASFAEALENACLTSKRFKILNDTIIQMLDLCIRFSDLASMPKVDVPRRSMDSEACSFISARSDRRVRRSRNGQEDDEDGQGDDEDESDGEGYSTFVLEENSTVAKELADIRLHFFKQGAFLVAGLRALARHPGELGESFDMLAAKLAGVCTRL